MNTTDIPGMPYLVPCEELGLCELKLLSNRILKSILEEKGYEIPGWRRKIREWLAIILLQRYLLQLHRNSHDVHDFIRRIEEETEKGGLR